MTSPDGRWEAEIREHNLFVKARETGEERQLTSDGSADHYYSSPLRWSPDSRKLVADRVKPGKERRVQYIESSPEDQVQPKLSSRVYPKPGDVITVRKPSLFHVESGDHIQVDDALFENPYHMRGVRWLSDSAAFVFQYNERGHQSYRVLRVDAETGQVRAVVDEQCQTFFDYYHKLYLHWCKGDSELIWASERDGRNHLYLYDAETGDVKNRITRGEWVVRGVDHVDEERRQIWFRASGRNPGEDPYHVHHYRIGFDGSGLVALTSGDGTHSVQLSPSRRYLIDTYSRVDMEPVHVLRSTSDGAQVCELERTDVEDLLATGWRWPEPFRAKGRDGKTDIYGVIYRPMELDESGSYPVVEDIYAGPHDSFVPKAFSTGGTRHGMAQLGFIIVQIDGMGTNNRSKVFHDVCWRNLIDSGLPDRIAWLRSAAERYPYMDLERVGIYGHSAGGQSAAAALFTHPEFYKVGVSSCGCHDNRMDKISWSEQWMGWPVGPHYAANSNVTHAGKLEGKLLLVVGELDHNVDPASTMQVVNALIRANKDFDLLVLPGQRHSMGGVYGLRRRWDYFVRHLLGVEPPDDHMVRVRVERL